MAAPEPPLILPPARRMLALYLVGGGLAILLSAAYVLARHPPPVWPALTLGWSVAAAGAAAGLIIKRMALGGDLTGFLIWGLLVNVGRAAILLIFVVAAHRADLAGFRAFVVAVFSGYFTCMVCEIIILHTMTSGGRSENESE